MPGDDFGERTEAPTPRRLEEARQRGQVPRSTDLTAALVLLASVGALYLAGGHVGGTLMAALRTMLGGVGEAEVTGDTVMREFTTLATTFAWAVAPVMGLIVAAAVVANLVQSGPVFSTQPLSPSPEKLDPMKGFGRIFSRRSLMRFLGSLLKLAAIAWVSTVVIVGDADRIVAMSGMSIEQIAAGSAELVLGLGLKLSVIFVVLAILDYLYQRWQYTQDLRMTKQELREELKRMEGDPMIREQRRSIQRRLAMQRMAAEVPKADAVITNPTHVAVAIRYDAEQMAAPTVVAKGADHLARRIREIAMEHGVPIVEKPPLARALYKAVEVGQEVPVEFYKAVAEVLAFVYRLTHRQFNPNAA